jgi:hypothetical protein
MLIRLFIVDRIASCFQSRNIFNGLSFLFRLATYGLAELQMEGDGNCQFRALADQLFRNADYHKHVRKHVVKQVLPENHNASHFLVHKCPIL